MAPGAQRSSKRVIMGFTVREPLVLEECPVMERRLAFLAHKTVGMPLQNVELWFKIII